MPPTIPFPNAIAREISIDKNTGKVNGLHFVEKHSKREMHIKAKAVVVAASCNESTRLLLNSKIANSSGVLGHYLMDQSYIGNSVVALVPEGAPLSSLAPASGGVCFCSDDGRRGGAPCAPGIIVVGSIFRLWDKPETPDTAASLALLSDAGSVLFIKLRFWF